VGEHKTEFEEDMEGRKAGGGSREDSDGLYLSRMQPDEEGEGEEGLGKEGNEGGEIGRRRERRAKIRRRRSSRRRRIMGEKNKKKKRDGKKNMVK